MDWSLLAVVNPISSHFLSLSCRPRIFVSEQIFSTSAVTASMGSPKVKGEVDLIQGMGYLEGHDGEQCYYANVAA